MSIVGTCQCGACAFTINTEINNAYYCHCRMCQKAMGNLFATFVTIKKEQLSWQKQSIKFYQSSEKAKRGFCSECGTPLSFEYLNDDKIHVTVGSLDNPDNLIPKGHTGIESRIKNFSWDDELPKFETE